MRRIEPSSLPGVINVDHEAHRALQPPCVVLTEIMLGREPLGLPVVKRRSCWEESLSASLCVIDLESCWRESLSASHGGYILVYMPPFLPWWDTYYPGIPPPCLPGYTPPSMPATAVPALIHAENGDRR